MNSSLTESTPEADWEFCCQVEPRVLVEFSKKHRWVAGKLRRRLGAVGCVFCLIVMASGMQLAMGMLGLLIFIGVGVSGFVAVRQRPWLTRGVLIAVREDALQVSVDDRALLLLNGQLQRMGPGDEVRPGEVLTQPVTTLSPSMLSVDRPIGLLFLPGDTLIGVLQEGRLISEI